MVGQVPSGRSAGRGPGKHGVYAVEVQTPHLQLVATVEIRPDVAVVVGEASCRQPVGGCPDVFLKAVASSIIDIGRLHPERTAVGRFLLGGRQVVAVVVAVVPGLATCP